MASKNIDLSIVLTCYNEMEHIQHSMNELIEYLDSAKIKYELILIDDCSADGTAQEIIKLGKKCPFIRCYLHQKNVGRGGTVAEGIIKASGDVVGYIDIDLEVPPAYILPCYLSVKQGYDVVIANRRYNVKFGTIVRYILSRGYNYLARKMLNIPFTDTEAGYKFFNREKIMPILKDIGDSRWFFDTEIVVRPYLHGYKIKEIPALYIRNNAKTSTVHIFRDSKDYFVSLLRFRKEVKQLKSALNEKSGTSLQL